ncbi:CRISPR-associated protein, Cse1 family [Candidatus Syntrophocurvum alkaliphilum]|uniref:CRISPR-associated protein, Cse1 family n=1 Tax=Candidatus Syntrophocurvum alkaliphilum TaxID=2293317 RepID=A0A6I6DE90_9FIRM|nr:type I-E CRISPR-associated protein Cse1/CasA [Candidatus Syntrophocurvum alkaliphilum]QGT99546.1 CRISPR-associated protein, Cse1 family [Candidatus Syntrophocurvum alkaliphilum]
MLEKEFNLLNEPWIMVMKEGGETQEVSILELFRKAPEHRSLAGELPTQDVAILRLLLAVLHAVFGRYDINGNFAPLASPYAALERWKALWDKGSFPMEIIEKYLLHFEDRFYLFHPEHPFYQVAGIEKATSYTAAKLNGELSESNNKSRLFPQRAGSQKLALQYSEAARWLIYINAFDDTAAKPTQKGLPSPGAGWLGKLGLITAVGKNLFETLTLNLVFLKNGGDELWGEEAPVWESEKVKSEERREITIPDNPSALLTLQSRRLCLKRHEDKVVGCELLGGDFFPKENALMEQMTLWRNASKKKTGPPEYNPKRHDPSRQLWRDFSVLTGQSEGNRTPGIISWLARLKGEQLISRTHFHFMTAAVKYGDKDFFADDVFSDSITFSGELLTDLGESWVNRIIGEIETTDRLVDQVGQLARNLVKASGNAEINGPRNAAKEQAYYRINQPFRRWLASIDPHKDDDKKDELCSQWWEQAKGIIQDLGKEMVNKSGPQAFAGRVEKDERTGKEYRYTAPEAYNRFLYQTSNRETLNRLYKKED